MIKVQRSTHYERNTERYPCRAGEDPCLVCGKPIKQANQHHMVHLHNGGWTAVTEAEAAELDARDHAKGVTADLGGWPIGPDCLRQHPELLPYVQGDPIPWSH